MHLRQLVATCMFSNVLHSVVIQRCKWLVVLSFVFCLRVFAQFQAGLDFNHPFIILLNTDSAYYQTQSQGWFKFNTGGFSNINGNAVTLKAALIPTNSRVILYDTVFLQRITIYDSLQNIVFSDTIHHYWDTLKIQVSLNKNQNYWIQAYANYPCGSCEYPDQPVAYQLKLIGENPDILCDKPSCGFVAAIGNPTTNCTYNCSPSSASGAYNGPCIHNDCVKGCTMSFSVSNAITFCDDAVPDSPTYISFLQNFHNSTTVQGKDKDTVDVCNPDNIYIAPLIKCAGQWNTYCIVPSFVYNYLGNNVPAVYVNIYNTSNGTLTNYPVTSWPFHLPPGALQPGVLYVVDYTYIDLGILSIQPNYCGGGGQIPHTTSCCQYYLRLTPPPSVSITSNQCAVSTTGTVCVNYHFPLNPADIASGQQPSFASFCNSNECTILNQNSDPAWSFSGDILNSNGQSVTTISVNVDLGGNPDVSQCYNLLPGVYTLSVQLNMPQPCYCNFPTTFIQTFTVENCCTPSFNNFIAISDATLVPYGTPGAIPFSSLSSNNINTGLIAIPSTGVISGNFTFGGNITIQTNVTFNNTEVVLQEAATVIQQNGANMNIFYSYWHGCNKNWNAIVSGDKITIKNSVIEDAANAVFIMGLPMFPPIVHNGIIIDNVIFNKNLTGINIINARLKIFQVTDAIFTSRKLPVPYTFGTGGAWAWRCMAAYDPSIYSTYPTANLLGSTILGISSIWRGQVGIQLNKAVKFPTNSALVIGQTSTSSQCVNLQTNVFDNLRIGVNLLNGANSQVLNSQFQYINYQPAIDNGNLTAGVYSDKSSLIAGTPLIPVGISNKFIKSDVGIVNTNNGAFTIQKNQFIQCLHGIDVIKWNASNTSSHLIQNNNFQNCFIDVYAWENISIKARILNNNSTFTSPPSLVKGFFVCNVYLTESAIRPQVQYTVSGNTFQGKRHASVYAINQNGLYITSNNLKIVPPSMAGNIYNAPIWLDNVHASYIVNNDLSCSPTAHTEWNSFGIFNNLGQNNEFCGNKIYNVGVCMKIQGNCPSNIWNNEFSPNAAQPSLVGIHLAHFGFVGDIAYTPVSANCPASNIFGYFSYADTYCSHQSNLNFPAKIYYNPNPLGNQYEPVNNTYDLSSNNIPFYPFFKVPVNIPNNIAACTNLPGMKISPAIAKIINNQVPVWLPHKPVIHRGIYEFIRHNNVNPAAVNGASFVAVQKTQPNEQWLKVDSLNFRYLTLQDSNAIQLSQTLLTSVTPITHIDSVALEFYQLYSSYLTTNTLSTTNFQKLQHIAGLCPFTDGLSVYQARGLLAGLDTLFYYNGCEVNLPIFNNSRLMQTQEESYYPAEPLVIIYPNPANERWIVGFSKKDLQLEITDVMGKVIWKENLVKSPLYIDIRNYPEGMYLYKVYRQSKVVESGKLVIQH
ncbi:MAG: hypothetical protein KatS3mg027_0118 [Bacteroidia bacterium]|nr:MAG: hypothetical protein KatS3mg027_0118 [Bacteroidia bacterium]